MEDSYEQYYKRFTPEKYDRFVRALEETIGHQYKLSTTPFFLTRSRFERLVETTNSIVTLLQSAPYQEKVASTAWFLPQNPMRPADYFGDVEFHVGSDEEKIIEINFNPPGHVGLLELLETSFLDAFDPPSAYRVNEGFEKALVRAVTDDFRYKRVAIGVNHLAVSAPYYPHYRYFERIFGKFNVDSRVEYACDVQFDDKGFPVWDGKHYDRILNLLIVRIWEDNPELFGRYTQAYVQHPEMFFLNPFGWKLGNKSFLTACCNLERENFGLTERDVTRIKRSALETHLLSEFAAPDDVVKHFGGLRTFVLKPLDDYGVKGVAIRPPRERLEEIFERRRDHYVVQEYFPPGRINCISENGGIERKLFSLRMGFLTGKFFGMRGYNFTDPPTHDELTPVVVV